MFDSRASRMRGCHVFKWGHFSAHTRARSVLPIVPEPYFQVDLVVGNFAVFNMSPCFDDFEPLEVAKRRRRRRNGILYGIFDRFWGRSDYFRN
jgi:hypothetical protein